jgi:hypothetical protein
MRQLDKLDKFLKHTRTCIPNKDGDGWTGNGSSRTLAFWVWFVLSVSLIRRFALPAFAMGGSGYVFWATMGVVWWVSESTQYSVVLSVVLLSVRSSTSEYTQSPWPLTLGPWKTNNCHIRIFATPKWLCAPISTLQR